MNVSCPECGKEFASNHALGTHRSRAHSVEGASRSAKKQTSPAGLMRLFDKLPEADLKLILNKGLVGYHDDLLNQQALLEHKLDNCKKLMIAVLENQE